MAPALLAQGDYDLYASALDGPTRVFSNPATLSVGPFVTACDPLYGAGNRDMVAYNTGTLAYTMELIGTVIQVLVAHGIRNKEF